MYDTDETGLFDPPKVVHPPLAFVGICDVCGAETEPIPHEDLSTGERLDPGAPWMTPVSFALITISRHKQTDCPGPPPEQPGIHLRPLNPNYQRETDNP